LVQLRPTLPEQDNRLSGHELFQVKKKFLADFRAVIEQHQPSVIQTIYKAHADEVVRYTNNENMFSLELLRQEIDNFPLHVFTLLNASDALDRSTQQVATDDQIKALEAQLQEIQRKLDYKQLELDDARKSMSYRITAIWRILTKDRFL
jgi:hypothetical protein